MSKFKTLSNSLEMPDFAPFISYPPKIISTQLFGLAKIIYLVTAFKAVPCRAPGLHVFHWLLLIHTTIKLRPNEKMVAAVLIYTGYKIRRCGMIANETTIPLSLNGVDVSNYRHFSILQIENNPYFIVSILYSRHTV